MPQKTVYLGGYRPEVKTDLAFLRAQDKWLGRRMLARLRERLTWATVDQACGAPLTRSQRFWRRVLS